MGPEAHPYVTGEDRSLVNMPLFHAGGTIYVIMTLARGGSCFIDTHFKTEEFWTPCATGTLRRPVWLRQ